MIYQLPCGRVVYMSIDEYLSLPDSELNNNLQSSRPDNYDNELADDFANQVVSLDDLDFEDDSEVIKEPFNFNNLTDEQTI
jgi:hypothetical protein